MTTSGIAPPATALATTSELMPGLELLATPQPKGAYRVLARKYRPSSFADLIGQEAMVRTFANAFRLDRIHQAYMLTGVRGVGKTTTARILARAFNYQVPAHDGKPAVDRPTIDMPEIGVHCQAIIDSRHIDVIELDAASHTGVDDVREIIENAQFRPVLARIKVYIIDEVHMLSKAAFNALLKTLEEPPGHVKFLFATTEIEKVPVTVRSRCQRFDLRRIEPDVMIAHLAGICEKEQVAIDAEALALVARAAEGSVRDALSLLDQAIAMGANAGEAKITGDALRSMLGSAERGGVIDIFEAVTRGDVARALGLLKEQYDRGADPSHVITGIIEFVHLVTRIKVVPDMRIDASMTPEEFSRGAEFAAALTLPVLTRAWQLLTKGLQEMRDAPRPLAAADMVLVRLAHAADLPSPEDVLRKLANAPAPLQAATPAPAHTSAPVATPAPTHTSAPVATSAPASLRAPTGGGGGGAGAAARQIRPQLAAVAQAAVAAPRVRLAGLEDVVKLAQAHRDIQLKIALERDIRLVRFDEGAIEFSLVEGASSQIAQTLMRRLQEWTGQRWMVAIVNQPGASSLKEQETVRRAEQMTGMRAEPLVRSVLERFPGAEIVAIRSPADIVEDAPASATPIATDADGEEVAYVDQAYTEDDL